MFGLARRTFREHLEHEEQCIGINTDTFKAATTTKASWRDEWTLVLYLAAGPSTPCFCRKAFQLNTRIKHGCLKNTNFHVVPDLRHLFPIGLAPLQFSSTGRDTHLT
jgi:hypothetical protein